MFKHRILWGPMLSVSVVFIGVAVGKWQSGGADRSGPDEKPLEGLNNFGTVPDFALIERSGKRLSLSGLRGKAWVVDFIYTRCRDTCPLQSAMDSANRRYGCFGSPIRKHGQCV